MEGHYIFITQRFVKSVPHRKMAAEREVALLMIKAIEAALNPLTTQQERKEAYEVVFYITNLLLGERK